MKSRKLLVFFLLPLLGFFAVLADGEETISHPSDIKNKKTIEFNGYIQGWFKIDFANENSYSSFLVKRARLGARGNLTSRISFKLMADFAQRENILFDAYADINIKENLSLRFGQHKTPFSRVNLRSASKLYLIERPFYQAHLTPPIRDIGFQLSYNRPKFEFIGGIYNGEGRTKADRDGIKNISLRAVLKAIPNLDIAANIYFSHKKIGFRGDRLKMYGFDFHYHFFKFFLEGEVVKRQVSLIGALNGTGYYLTGGGKFSRDETIKVEPLFRFEYFDVKAPFLGLQEWQVIGGINLYNDTGNVKLSVNLGHIAGGRSGETLNKFLLQLQLLF